MYEIGDVVRVKTREEFKEMKGYTEYSDGSCEVRNDGYLFVPGMIEYCGMIGRVTKLKKLWFEIDIDDGGWIWEDWMVVSIEEERREKILEVLNA